MAEAPYLPTRVIEVGDDPDRLDAPVKLLEARKPAKQYNPRTKEYYDGYERLTGHYLTLSHRWDADAPFTTKMETLSQRLDSILFNDLPATFRDAIVVARKLGIPYVWIDSLCILQEEK